MAASPAQRLRRGAVVGCRRIGRYGCSTLPASGPVGGSLMMDGGRHRQADEQRRLVRVVIDQLDPHRQALHDLHEVAGRVFRRQQRQRRAGPHREAGDAALEALRAAVHVHVQVDRLADPQVGELRFLEVGIDPDFRQRAHGHQALAGDDVVPGIHVAARDDAVDLRRRRRSSAGSAAPGRDCAAPAPAWPPPA